MLFHFKATGVQLLSIFIEEFLIVDLIRILGREKRMKRQQLPIKMCSDVRDMISERPIPVVASI
ncbi:hypothetical protein ACFY5J_20235 [Peribacillus butanolivorans]|uniref:hypothetical protein n=1 Tax=Peribacillus butanolivorans TaxID=421767 RepID=UPI00368F5750